MDQAIQIANKGYVWIDREKYPLVDLEIMYGELTDVSKLNYTWSCINFTKTFIDF